MAAPTYRANGGIAYGSSTSVAVAYPTLSANNILIIQLISNDGDGNHAQPTGFSPIATQTVQSTNSTNSWWWKRATGSESGTLSCTRSAATGDGFWGVMSSWAGAVTVGTPFNTVATSTGRSSSATSTAITPTYDNSRIICLLQVEDNLGNGTFSGGNYAEDFDLADGNTTDAEISCCSFAQTTAAQEASQTSTLGGTDSWSTCTLALWSAIPLTINATKGAATGTGYNPDIVLPSVPTNISATLATATGTPYDATVQADVDTVVSVGSLALIDSLSQPSSPTDFDCDADGVIIFTFTPEVASNNGMGAYFRRAEWNSFVEVIANNVGELILTWYDGADWHEEAKISGVYSDGVSATTTITYNGTSIIVDVGGVEKINDTVNYNLTVAAGRCEHDLDTNDIELDSYSLGGVASCTATAYDATLNIGTGITATKGTASGTPYQATVQAIENVVVSCTKGAASGTSYAATVQADVDLSIVATLGTATVTGYDAALSLGTVVIAAAGTATASPGNATINAGLIIPVDNAGLVVTGNNAAISANLPTIININNDGALIDSVTSPSSPTDYDCNASGVIVFTFTPEITAGNGLEMFFRRAEWNSFVEVMADNTGALKLIYYDGDFHDVAVVNSVYSDGVSATTRITYVGRSIIVEVDDIEKINEEINYNLTVAAGRVSHDLDTNDIQIDTYKLAGSVVVSGLTPLVSGLTYYIRADGTATKGNAVGPETDSSKCMSMATHQSSPFGPGDTIIVSGLGGIIRSAFNPRSGSSESDVTYSGSNSPIISAARLTTGWTNYSGDVWQAAVTTEPEQIWIDNNYGDRKTSILACVNEYDWFWASNVLYLYAPGDPDTQYTTPGVECGATDGAMTFDAGSSYITVDGITFEKSNRHGANTNGLDHITIKNCTFQWHFICGAQFGGPDDVTYITVEDCLFRYNGSRGLSVIAIGSLSNIVARRNSSYSNGYYQYADPSWDAELDGGAGIKLWTGDGIANDCIIECNKVYDNGPPVVEDGVSYGAGIWFDHAGGTSGHENHVHQNVIYNNNGVALYCELTNYTHWYNNLCYDNAKGDESGVWSPSEIRCDSRDGMTASYNKFYNNTCYGGLYGIICLTTDQVGSPQVSYNEFRNNIVVGTTDAKIYADTGGDNDGSNGTGNVYNANCLGAEGAGFIYWNATDYATYDAWIAASSQTDNNVEADPALKDTANDKYYLTSASPCIDTGVNLGATYDDGLDPHITAAAWPSAVVTLDQDSWGSGWEVGAYVYDYADVATATTTTYAATILTGSQTVNATVGAATVTGYDIGLAADLVIPCTSDAATVAGYDASVSTESGIVITKGTATATAFAATISADQIIAASSGTATGTAYAATVQADVDVTVLATAAAATATDYAAVVNVGTGITATAGAATATGYDVALAADNSITATLGTATGTANAADVILGAFVPAGVAAATVTGYNPTVLAALAIPATAGTATATGYDATVAADLVVPITLGVVTVTGYNATLDANTVVMATVANAVATALNPGISGITSISATKATATATGYAADVGADVTITATLGTAALTALDTLLTADVTTVATKGTVTVTGYNPLVLLPIDITATLGTATATANSAAVNVGTGVTVDVAAATGTAHNPTVYAPLGIDQTSTPAITVTGLDPTVFEGIINITCGTITVTAKVPTVSIPFRFLISPTITSSTISYTTTSTSIDYSIEELA